MGSPNWEEIGEKYSVNDIENLTNDLSRYFGKDAKNNIHNDIFNSLRKKSKKGDLHRYSIVQHSQELLPGIQKKLLASGKVLHYVSNGRDIYRSNVDWNNEDLGKLRSLRAEGKTDKEIGKTLGRSRSSVKHKRSKLGIA